MAVAPELRAARTCYDHLAGVEGVKLCGQLLRKGWPAPAPEGVGRYQPAYALTPAGERALARRSVELPTPERGRRRFAFACPDWTEARPHLGGALAAAIFTRLQKDGVVQRRRGTRVVAVKRDIGEWLR